MTPSNSPDTYLLRIEGVNLSSFIFDTRDLSTARGGSLLLLSAIPDLQSCLPEGTRVLSQGASSGLFEITTNAPEAVAKKLREKIATSPTLSQATLVVDIAPLQGGFRETVENALAANRWRQMQASSLSLPAKSDATTATVKPACGLNAVLPAVNHGDYGTPNRNTDKASFLSRSAKVRRDHGLHQKQNFYLKVLERAAKHVDNSDSGRAAQYRERKTTLPKFAEHFEAIANSGDGPLGNKLAVFYADGNRFGSILARLCSDPESQQHYDEYLRSTRERFLAEFLTEESIKDAWAGQSDQGTILRFETLLWGGDEVMFVMPAALGWRFAAFFFKHLGEMKLSSPPGVQPVTSEPLTHAAALVFCQSHSPIQRIKHLAKDCLAEFAKSVDRDSNQLMCLALESFDHLGSDFRASLMQRYNHKSASLLPLEELLIKGMAGKSLAQTVEAIADGIEALRKSQTFARSQLRRLVSELIASPEGIQKIGDLSKRELPLHFRKADGAVAQCLIDHLAPLFPSPAALWIQLEELWDYARP